MTKFLYGPAGSATALDKPGNARSAATVASWLLHAPGQASAWHHFLLSVVHLRPQDGVTEPVITQPGATHEILLYALDPERNPSADDVETLVPLHPLNYVQQVTLPDDDAARVVLESAARGVVHGVLWAEPPLSGQTEPWVSWMLAAVGR